MDTGLLPALGYCAAGNVGYQYVFETVLSIILCVYPEVELVGHTVIPLSLFSNHRTLFHSSDTILHSCGGSFNSKFEVDPEDDQRGLDVGKPEAQWGRKEEVQPKLRAGGQAAHGGGWGGRDQGVDQGKGLCTSVGECDSPLRMGPTDDFEQRSDLTTLLPASFMGWLRLRGTVAEYSRGG